MERLARRGGFGSRAATAWLVRAADETQTLLELSIDAPDERVAVLARDAIEQAWAQGGSARDEVWQAAWRLLMRGHFGGPHQIADQLVPVLRFLLAPDATSPYRPRVRLTACLPTNAKETSDGVYTDHPVFPGLLRVASDFPDLEIRQQVGDLLQETDQPGLLAALEDEFAEQTGYQARYPKEGLSNCSSVWNWSGGQPRPALPAAFANPHLPRPPRHPAAVDLALLAILRGRSDQLGAYYQKLLARRVITFLSARMPDDARDACRQALRELPPGQGRQALCTLAVAGDAEALAAVIDAGFRPARKDKEALFLFATGQWDQYDRSDPDGRRLLSDLGHHRPKILLDRIRRDGVPDDVRDACRRALRELAPGPAREALCELAGSESDAEALAAVVDAGFRPAAEDTEALFLFATGQWDQYDRSDPDGRRLLSVASRNGTELVLDRLGRGGVPAAPASKARAALRRLNRVQGESPSERRFRLIARDAVRDRALWGDTEAIAAAVDAGYLSTKELRGRAVSPEPHPAIGSWPTSLGVGGHSFGIGF